MLILTSPVDHAQNGKDIDPTIALWVNCFIVMKCGDLGVLQAHVSASYCKLNMTVISALEKVSCMSSSLSCGHDRIMRSFSTYKG